MAKTLKQLQFLFRPRKPKPHVIAIEGNDFTDTALTQWCKEAAKTLGLKKIATEISVSWNPRMRTTAGRAWWPICRIELNPKLHEISEKEVWQTLKHELAHLIAFQRAGRKRIQPHGIEWKQACADLGIPGENARHTLSLAKSRKQKKNYAYTCPACHSKLERVRVFKRDVACFSCCKTKNSGRFHAKFRLVKSTLEEI